MPAASVLKITLEISKGLNINLKITILPSLSPSPIVTASSHPNRGEEDPAPETGEPGHVRMGDPGEAAEPEGVRPAQHPLRQFCQPHPQERRRLGG